MNMCYSIIEILDNSDINFYQVVVVATSLSSVIVDIGSC